jgi:hypothetical protein
MKYKINKNQPPLTDADLASARNFNQVLKGYQAVKMPFYKTGKFLTGGSALIVAAAVTLIMLFAPEDEVPAPYIAPPVAAVDIAKDTYTVDADSISEITYTSGSKLHIPAQAFKDADGKLVSGKVTLKYREFHDQKDIFISGIPMTYDSAGAKYVFESAGMMEITAYQNGKALQANPEKQIKVDMVSNTAEDKYNTYFLDTIAKRWINLNQANLLAGQQAPKFAPSDSMGVHAELYNSEKDDNSASNPVLIKYVEEVKKTTAAVKAVEKEKPMPIAKADKAKTRFHIVVDAGEFPEIAMYKGVRFQVKDEMNFDKSSAKTEWEDVKLKKLTGLDYEVDFTRGSKKMQVVATPVIDDKDMPAAQKVYDEKFAQYTAKLTERKAAEAKAKADYEARVKVMEEQLKTAIVEEKERDRIYETTLNKSDLVYRAFYVKNFGVYNFDHPCPWPTDASVQAALIDEKGEKLNIITLNLVEKGRNIVFPYNVQKGECKDFKFNAQKDNTLWAVTAENKLAIVDINSFKAQQGRSGKVQFKFKIIDQELKTSDEVRKYLEI